MAGDEIRDIPWVEKYRPNSLKDIASQTLTIESLLQFVEKRTLPHLIFTGPAGTGKTSAAKALINDLLGLGMVPQDAILEKNASDEVRMDELDEIKNFVFHTGIQQSVTFKFVILDEADLIPKDVQSAFRRIIEMAPPNVKFIFMCNYVENMIDPILSRCAIFRFYPLPQDQYQKVIEKIAAQEHVPITPEILDAIYYISLGDMRLAINLFQLAVAMVLEENDTNSQLVITPDTVYEISGFFPPAMIDEIMGYCQKREYQKILEILRVPRGLSSRAFIRQIMDYILNHIVEYPLREQLLNILAEYDFRLTLEADPVMQLDGLFAELIIMFNQN